MSIRLLPDLARKLQFTPVASSVRYNTSFNSQPADVSGDNKSISDSERTPPDDMPALDMKNPFEKEKPKCILCKYDITPNYKNVKLLSQFISPYTGRIYGRHITRLCKAKQAVVESEILKSQNCGLMPYYFKQPYLMKDPKLFDAENPLRPHSY